MSYQTFVLVSDTHGSFICPSWRKAVLKFCKDVKPDRRIHCGDVWDFTCLMKKASEEQRMVAIADDLEAGMEFLNDFLSFVADCAEEKFEPKLFFRLRAIDRRNLGIINANPNRSVSIPGVSKTIPPTTIIAPSINLSVGGRPCFNSFLIRDRV